MPSGTSVALLRPRPVRPSRAAALIARVVAVLLLLGVVVVGVLAGASPASAHGFSSVVYAKVTSTEPTVVHAELGLEYDLMLVSVATSEHDDPCTRRARRPGTTATSPAWCRRRRRTPTPSGSTCPTGSR